MSAQVRRALLFIPGDDRHKIEKGVGLDVDAVILDLEDGVALNRKKEARLTLSAALRELDFGRSERWVRINPVIEGGLHLDDLDGTISGMPDGYVIPKVERADQIQSVSDYLTHVERKADLSDGHFRLLAIVETALGIVNLKAIASADWRLAGLIFGAEDLAGDMGARRTPDGWEVFYARSAVVLHAKAHHLDAIDTPFINLTGDDSQLIAQTEQAQYMGYTGKLAIHPRQVEPIQRIFTPTADEIDAAQRLIAAFETHQAAGTGVFQFEGRMAEMPMVRAAQQVIARARAAGLSG
jgi:citrate lyase beta subunit